ncbi:hypothetical protein LshimejAT787_0411820 [Lyophyllum shimeji]|uniref:Uncharacterized protein n=1 Tax=Lyophyllum shimeji TaxID=47721 RepID=A0A9P3PMP8_LYOSH|nr:hypothetical protein LshimejAT787_0411820 [Lyophyllum shimeji]
MFLGTGWMTCPVTQTTRLSNLLAVTSKSFSHPTNTARRYPPPLVSSRASGPRQPENLSHSWMIGFGTGDRCDSRPQEILESRPTIFGHSRIADSHSDRRCGAQTYSTSYRSNFAPFCNSLSTPERTGPRAASISTMPITCLAIWTVALTAADDAQPRTSLDFGLRVARRHRPPLMRAAARSCLTSAVLAAIAPSPAASSLHQRYSSVVTFLLVHHLEPGTYSSSRPSYVLPRVPQDLDVVFLTDQKRTRLTAVDAQVLLDTTELPFKNQFLRPISSWTRCQVFVASKRCRTTAGLNAIRSITHRDLSSSK